MSNLLTLKNLSVQFKKDNQVIPAVKKASLEIGENEIVGLVGESGSGKTVTSLALTRILPPNAQVTKGKAIFESRDLLKLTNDQLTQVRGSQISYIFQEPIMFLNPLLTIGAQVSEAIAAHQRLDKFAAMQKTIALLGKAALPAPEQVYYDYPHQLSGGMNQRAMIAQALVSNPKLLIADEPTTSLDADTESQILNLILDLQKKVGFSCLFITHNLGLVKKICQRVYVMYQGSIVETATLDGIFNNPQHEHTKALIDAYEKIG